MKAALVGSGIGPSLTPGMHEAEGRAQGLAYRYERFDTALAPWKDMSLSAILDHAEAQGYAGLNITHPHKMQVARHLDALSDASQALGTVNTIVFRDGRRSGHTTDYSGFAAALQAFDPRVEGVDIVQFGAGGAGAATALALVDAGARLTLVDLDEARAEALADQLRAARPAAQIRSGSADLARAAGAVNATPLGMDAYPGMAFDPQRLGPGAWVADIVYFPLETALTRAARARGLRVMNGGAMALYQAVAAFELITGHTASASRMRASFDQLMAARGGA
ncbi:shikimate dehydrogenase [Ponticoccus sp. SC2-23]|uniref:shikimate dehydrogenase n=1 Tax=Alexandriicola marinus TaxID=2081710 RepID=UPI000FD8AF83|nr:shikimate dehydrogenase [Alexandriicola marinus]MBM1219824.1 shikimate dehydrogenase [Ponticoccus sp. SC6-9]MBM1223104.1 shikimate dehydrogenase [Ponticoccus sp. SC6-15]MBM1229637.1 shikimate dehydrogenase [Ponticoccus sp. SC6-38]MBM1232070.1 shikimate dehydrogenase [Ponticoccus sp. SC6-45]MBM1237980.1 shikimate dehydrogenase [Ponticoccus sp. SC6-49]MBM1241081.1 shikimate dehydrogenase [Ponticoccus sp. SC2-64]MBM1245594.1 shikimate dehydrogenase [Ponticoccus sp. SC6-42]MBM1250072.1 shiki